MAIIVGTKATVTRKTDPTQNVVTDGGSNYLGYGGGDIGVNQIYSTEKIVNSYAKVLIIATNQITIGNSLTDAQGFGTFEIGDEVLVHVAAYKGSEAICTPRGKWINAVIRSKTAGEGGNTVLKLSKSCANLCKDLTTGTTFPIAQSADADGLFIQVVSIPHFYRLRLDTGGSITCPEFTAANGYGGVVALKCSSSLILNGGHINVAGKGIQSDEIATLWNSGSLRHENEDGSRDLRKSAGWENYRARQHLTINSPDGAVFVMTKELEVRKNTSRIGNPQATGVARLRSATASVSYDGDYVTAYDKIGGASIFMVASTISNWSPNVIAKYPSNTDETLRRGRQRCYIASNTKLPTDEGLYSYDIISKSGRLTSMCNVTSFGDGSNNACDASSAKQNQMNSYASINKVTTTQTDNEETSKLKIGTISNGAYVQNFPVGSLVMVHVSQKAAEDVQYVGRFMLAKVVSTKAQEVTIDKAVFADEPDITTDKYNLQLIAIPQFTTFTLTGENDKTPAYNSETGCGGLFAIAVSDLCNISGGKINVEGKGNKSIAYGEAGLNYIDNIKMCDRLPIGQGHGSVFILAKTLKMNSSTRIGATYTGNALGGINYSYYTATTPADGNPRNSVTQIAEGGRLKPVPFSTDITAGGKNMDSSAWNSLPTTGGNNAGGTYTINGMLTPTSSGGYGSNSKDGDGNQGAHIFIAANEIQGLNVCALSTGGEGGSSFGANSLNKNKTSSSKPGGCGHGGSGGTSVCTNVNDTRRGANGGFIGGGAGHYSTSKAYASGGGSSGFCFIYCNKGTNQNSRQISLDATD